VVFLPAQRSSAQRMCERHFSLAYSTAWLTYEHGGAKVELVKQLRDEDVRLDDLLVVDVLDTAQDVEQPLELTLTRRHPDEVHLHAHAIASSVSE